MTEEELPTYDAMDLLHNMGKDAPYMCRTPNTGLSYGIKDNDYDYFMKVLSAEIRATGRVDVDSITVRCEGQCPKGCEKKFNLKLGKSLTKRSFYKMYKHGQKYPQHCLTLKYEGDIHG